MVLAWDSGEPEITYEVKGGRGGGSVTAYAKGAGLRGRDLEVGLLNWGSDLRLHHLGVHMDYHRRGIARQMWQLAQKATGGQLSHSPDRTDAGEKFARAVGGKTPPRSDWRP